ncbi:MAG: hypothetical protein JRG92_16110 [Deltaproteobacteria bacterium]|nr:hypothetical protein [Deltaproteobacteria bacterium]
MAPQRVARIRLIVLLLAGHLAADQEDIGQAEDAECEGQRAQNDDRVADCPAERDALTKGGRGDQQGQDLAARRVDREAHQTVLGGEQIVHGVDVFGCRLPADLGELLNVRAPLQVFAVGHRIERADAHDLLHDLLAVYAYDRRIESGHLARLAHLLEDRGPQAFQLLDRGKGLALAQCLELRDAARELGADH